MNLLKSFINKTHELGCGEAIQASVNFLFGVVVKKISTLPYYVSGMIDYHFNPNALKQRNIEPLIDNERIRKEFIHNGFRVVDYDVDKADFTQWLHEVKFPEDYIEEYEEVFTEKALEHYLSSKFLELNENDVFVDVAAALSPWYDLAEKRYKCKSFAVDLHLPPKNDPRLIRCDATNMPFSDESISKIALHCAYEMFENSADMNLIKEVNRVLKPAGKMVIIPLYMAHFYHIQSSPKVNRKGIEYGEAKRVWLEDKNGRFVRIYSVEAFKERVTKCKGKLNLKIFYFTNQKEMKVRREDQVYAKFAACFTKE